MKALVIMILNVAAAITAQPTDSNVNAALKMRPVQMAGTQRTVQLFVVEKDSDRDN